MKPRRGHYISAAGERIEIADYLRWLDRAQAALDCLTEDFGMEPDEDDEFTKLGDLLCHLQHWAQAHNLSFADALARAEMNYDAERREVTP